ncbi:MAG: hypothetical protein J7J91_00980 [Deltaproteobacteria bacterium]|nr:hypothetical protein [Deltaproteobacteria bacterium]
MAIRDVIKELRKAVEGIIKEGQETRRELQYLAHSVKITPIRNMLMDEVRYRRPLHRIRRFIRGEE